MEPDKAKNDIIVEESDNSSTSTTTPVIEPAPADDSDGLALKATRSRRPTMNILDISPSLMGVHRKESEIEPAVKEPWTVKRVFKVTWTYVTTVKGFLITMYMLQVVAWGGMLFLLICNAAPAMCHPSCDDLYSARKIWIEIDSQILNALFCVTGLGLLPWRGRDTWLLYKKNWTKLSKIHSGWYIDGVTKRALMYWVVILFLMNSIWQIALALTMWCLNRFDRPGWTTGLIIAVSFLCAIGAGGIEWWEVRRRKKLQRVGKVAPPEDVVRRNSVMMMEKVDSGNMV